MKHFLFFTLLITISCVTNAAIEALEFETQEQQQRYQNMIAELRCLVCQNQNLADSDAELAQDLRSKTYEMILNGNSDAEIYEFMQSRYGDFVLYRPPFNSKTWLLWFGPLLLLLLAIGIAFKSIRMRAEYNKGHSNEHSEKHKEMTQANKQKQTEQQRIQNLLRDTPSLSGSNKQKANK